MYNKRQFFSLNTMCEVVDEIIGAFEFNDNKYKEAVRVYLSLWVDRVASYCTSFGRWIPKNEQLASVFGKQAVPMVFDYPEVCILSTTTSGALNQLSLILGYINHESSNPFWSICNNSASGDKMQFNKKELDVVVTDPPYYDAIAYADLSDLFYMWLKKNLSDSLPLVFARPQTPKSDECTMLKHYHNGDKEKAKQHFEQKLLQIFDSIEFQTRDMVSVMFAHQSTEAWSTICKSILGSRLNITSSWAIYSERDSRMIANGTAALESSVTIGCVPTKAEGVGDFKAIIKKLT